MKRIIIKSSPISQWQGPWPIRGKYPGHMISLNQSEAYIQVTWLLWTNESSVSRPSVSDRDFGSGVLFWGKIGRGKGTSSLSNDQDKGNVQDKNSSYLLLTCGSNAMKCKNEMKILISPAWTEEKKEKLAKKRNICVWLIIYVFSLAWFEIQS